MRSGINIPVICSSKLRACPVFFSFFLTNDGKFSVNTKGCSILVANGREPVQVPLGSFVAEQHQCSSSSATSSLYVPEQKSRRIVTNTRLDRKYLSSEPEHQIAVMGHLSFVQFGT